MTLYSLDADRLVPVRRALAGGDLYEQEIEELAWRNLREFTGEELFLVRRNAGIPAGAVDIVALTRQGEVAVIAVTVALDRGLLAECLEYAGWARGTSLDELAGLYLAGAAQFWRDWRTFTCSAKPVRIQRSPLVVIIARHVDSRMRAAVTYLSEHGVPLRIVRVTVYEGAGGVRMFDVEASDEPSIAGAAAGASSDGLPPLRETPRRDSRRVGLLDLLEAGLIEVGADLVWSRPRVGQEYAALITAEGQIALPDGREFTTPSAAAMAAANLASCDGWHAWRVGSPEGPYLNDLREALGQMADLT